MTPPVYQAPTCPRRPAAPEPWGIAAGAMGGDGEIADPQFLLPRPVLDELIDAADEEGITAARLLRRLVVHHLKGKGR